VSNNYYRAFLPGDLKSRGSIKHATYKRGH